MPYPGTVQTRNVTMPPTPTTIPSHDVVGAVFGAFGGLIPMFAFIASCVVLFGYILALNAICCPRQSKPKSDGHHATSEELNRQPPPSYQAIAQSADTPPAVNNRGPDIIAGLAFLAMLGHSLAIFLLGILGVGERYAFTWREAVEVCMLFEFLVFGPIIVVALVIANWEWLSSLCSKKRTRGYVLGREAK